MNTARIPVAPLLFIWYWSRRFAIGLAEREVPWRECVGLYGVHRGTVPEHR